MKLFDIYGKIGVKGLEGFDAKLKQTRARLDRVNASMDKVGRIAKRAFIAAGAAIGIAVHQAMKFERSMANVSTMLRGEALRHMEAFTAGVRRLSVEFGEAKDSLAKGLYDILSASIDAAKAMDVLTVAVRSAKGGMTSAAISADAITTILNSYRMSADRAEEVSDKLFAAVLRGKMTFEQLAVGIGKAAATAAIANISLEELLAAVGTITRAGIRPRMAMTAIVGMIRSFLKPTEEASAAARKLGFELSTAAIKSEGLLSIFRKLNGLTAEQIALVFPNIRGLKGVAATMQDLEGFAYDLEIQYNSTGMAQEAFNKIQQTTAYRFDQTKQRIASMVERIGAALLPVLDELSRIVAAIEKGFSAMGKTMSTVLAKTLAYTAAVGATTYALTKLVKLYVILRTAILGVAGAQAISVAAGAGAAAGGAGIRAGIAGAAKAGLAKVAAAVGGVMAGIGAAFVGIGLVIRDALVKEGDKWKAQMEEIEDSSAFIAREYDKIAKHTKTITELQREAPSQERNLKLAEEQVRRLEARLSQMRKIAIEQAGRGRGDFAGGVWGAGRMSKEEREAAWRTQAEMATRLAEGVKKELDLAYRVLEARRKIVAQIRKQREENEKIRGSHQATFQWWEKAQDAMEAARLAGAPRPARETAEVTKKYLKDIQKLAEEQQKALGEAPDTAARGRLIRYFEQIREAREKIFHLTIADIEKARKREIDLYVKTGVEKQLMLARERAVELLNTAKTEAERAKIIKRAAAETSKIRNQARADEARRELEARRKVLGPKLEAAQRRAAARGGLAEQYARIMLGPMQQIRRESERMLRDIEARFGLISPEFAAAEAIAKRRLELAEEAAREPAGQWKGLTQVWKDLQAAAVKTPEQILGEEQLNVLKSLDKTNQDQLDEIKQMREQLKNPPIAVAG